MSRYPLFGHLPSSNLVRPLPAVVLKHEARARRSRRKRRPWFGSTRAAASHGTRKRCIHLHAVSFSPCYGLRVLVYFNMMREWSRGEQTFCLLVYSRYLLYLLCLLYLLYLLCLLCLPCLPCFPVYLLTDTRPLALPKSFFASFLLFFFPCRQRPRQPSNASADGPQQEPAPARADPHLHLPTITIHLWASVATTSVPNLSRFSFRGLLPPNQRSAAAHTFILSRSTRL